MSMEKRLKQSVLMCTHFFSRKCDQDSTLIIFKCLYNFPSGNNFLGRRKWVGIGVLI